VNHDQRHQRGERQLGDVERQLDRRQPAVEQQHRRAPHQTAEHDAVGGREDQREHQRDVGERERVRPAPKVQVHDAALGDGKRHRHEPPRHMRAVECRHVVHRAGVQRDRRGHHGEV
jgi:hypothetical protein